MKGLIFNLLIFSWLKSFSQEVNQSLESNVLVRYDKHANYNSRYNNNAYVNHITLNGINFGAYINYRTLLSHELFALLGVGYYQLRVDHISQSTPWGTTSSARSINYPDPSSRILYSTSNYYYNNFQINVGLDKELQLKKQILFIGCEYLYYYTVSQNYSLQNQVNWKTKFSRTLGYGIALTISVKKHSSSFYFDPKLIVSIFQNLKTDPVFLEEGKNIQKWINGIGIGLVIGKTLK